MASASISGLGSGIDFSKLTDAILAEKSRPVSQLQARGAQISKTNDAFKQLNAKLATLTEAVNTLTNKDLGKGRLTSSSNTDNVLLAATATAATGTFEVAVTRLATNLSQSSRVYAAANTAVLAGGATTATFELRLGAATTGTAITVTTANDSLSGLRDAINAAQAGVNAVIIDTDGSGTQNKLVLNSTATGTAGRVQLVETTATGTLTDLAVTSLNPPGATNDFSNLDAQFTVNGLTLTRSTNAVSDALAGVTFNLLRSGSSTVKITANTGELESKIKSFVVAYNDVQDFIAGQYSKDGAGRPSGALAGNPTLRSIQNQLRNTVGQSFANNGGPLKNLTEIGIGRDENGRLTLDSKILNERLTEKTVAGFAATSTEPKLVQPIVTGTSVSGSTSVDIIRLATSYVEESAELVTGAAILANPKIAATFQLQTGGQASGPTFSLTSANNSLKALRDAINGANAGVIARIESTAGLSEKLVLTSQVTGASNRVQLVEITNPPTGTGSNLKLTATSPGGDNYEELDSFIVINDAEKIFRPTNTISDYIPGLALNLLEIGRATVTVVASQKKTSLDDVRALLAGKEGFQKGLANEVYTSYKSISDDVIGLVKKAITGNENSIKGINKSIGDQLARISTLRQSLSRQFAAADAAISQLNSQGTSLTNIFTAQNNASNK